MKLYIRRNDKDFGPYPIEQVKQLLEGGRLVRNDQASEDKVAWRELDEFLETKNEAPPTVESLDSGKKPAEDNKLKKPISEGKKKVTINQQPKSSRETKLASSDPSSNQPDDKVNKPISGSDENGNSKPKKKLLGVLVYSVIVLIVAFAAFFLGTLINSSGKDNPVVVNTDSKTEEKDNAAVLDSISLKDTLLSGQIEMNENDYEVVPKINLQERSKDGDTLYYKPNELDPYTGYAQGWHKNGTTSEIYSYVNGRKHGPQISTYPWGKPFMLETYNNGIKSGKNIEWYQNEQKYFEKIYEMGKLISAEVWKYNGEKCPVTNFKDGNGVIGEYDFRFGGDVRPITYKKGYPVYE